MSNSNQSANIEDASALENKLPTTSRTKPVAVRSTRTPNPKFSRDPKATVSVATSTRTPKLDDKPENKPLNRVKTAPPKVAEPTRSDAIFPLSIRQSHSSNSQSFLAPDAQSQNPRESIASTEPSSYYSAEDSFNVSLEEDVPPLPNPHPLSTSTKDSNQTLSTTQTVTPTRDFNLTYRTSARTTASTSTRTTGRSASTSASLVEPSRQSTSDSDAYMHGNGTGAPNYEATAEEGEEDLANLVAGLEEFVEEPEFDSESPKRDLKGKMKMPEPQYFASRLSTTKEEDEDGYIEDEGDRTLHMPMPVTHGRNPSSSTQYTVNYSGPASYSFSNGPNLRKVSPLIIPPAPSSPPPPVPISNDEKKKVPGMVATGQGKTPDSKQQPDQDTSPVASQSQPPKFNPGGVAPLKIHRHGKTLSGVSGGVGEGISPAEKDDHFGTAMITGRASSRVERTEIPGSRTSMTTGSMSNSGRLKTDSTSHRETSAHGRSPSSVSGYRPPEKRVSGSSARPPKREKFTASAAAAVGAATIPNRRLPPGVSSQMDTQYVNMLLALDDIPTIHNLAIAFFNWIFLAGFVLFPGTFTSLKNLGAEQGNTVAAQLINTVTELPLFIVAWVCVGVGAVGMLWMFWRWRMNYVWALNKIWVPGLLNSLAGLLSTIASIYGAQHGQFSPASKSTLILTAVSTVLFAFLSLFYMFWLVRRVKKEHDKEVGRQRAGKHGEGFVERGGDR